MPRGSGPPHSARHPARATLPSGTPPLARAEITFPNAAAGAAACHPLATQARPARLRQAGAAPRLGPRVGALVVAAPISAGSAVGMGTIIGPEQRKALEGVSHPREDRRCVALPARAPPLHTVVGGAVLLRSGRAAARVLQREPCMAVSAGRRKRIWAWKRRLAGNPPQWLNQATKERSRTAPPPWAKGDVAPVVPHQSRAWRRRRESGTPRWLSPLLSPPHDLAWYWIGTCCWRSGLFLWHSSSDGCWHHCQKVFCPRRHRYSTGRRNA